LENLIPTQKSVSDLIDGFQSGTIAIPEIQRDIVWNSEQVKSLIDSISQGYPCGSLILWEPREKDKQLVRSMIRPERLDWYEGKLPSYFLLDGQQRVTALASVLLKRETLQEVLVEMEEEMPYIFVNLKRFPKEFEATTDLSGYTFPWILFNEMYDGSYHQDPKFAKLPPGTIEAIRAYVQRIRDYSFPVQIIRNRDYATVGEIFTRVNSEGTQLTGAEIHLARIVPNWRGITREFREYRRDLLQRNFSLDLTFLLRSIAVVECNVPQIKKLADRVADDRPSRAELNRSWRRAKGAIDRTIRTLELGLDLDKSKFVTSKNALVPLVYYFANQSNHRRIDRNALRFFLLSQLSEHFGSSGETTLRKDFRILANSSTPRQGLEELVDVVTVEAKQYYRGLRIKPDQVEGVPAKNVLILLMYILMRRRDATDWGIGKARTLEEIEPRDVQLHHIFPFNFMMKDKIAFEEYRDDGRSPADFRADVNDISNLTFISQAKNGSIGDTPPKQYLPMETTRQMRWAHFIPEKPELWMPENFANFLEERRKLLSKSMSSFLRSL
jgi:hypothetical protein